MNKFKASSDHDLYNEDLAPVEGDNKRISPVGYGFIWFGLSVQITAFMALSPLVSYFTIGQLIFVFVIGSMLIGILSFITQDIGIRYGISFATSVSVAFGYTGGKIINMIRTFPSLIFFGLNAYVGAIALNEIFKITLGYENIFLCIVINIAILVAITLRKIKSIEKFIAYISPLLFGVGIYMLYAVLSAYEVSFIDTLSMGNMKDTNLSFGFWLYSLAIVIGVFSSVALGANDYTRDCKKDSKSDKWFQSNKKYFMACFIGNLPLAYFALLGSITISLSGRMDVLVVISEIIQEKSMFLAILLQIFIIVAQASTNAASTLLPSAYAISGLMPKKISYKLAVFVFAILVFIVRPWALEEQLEFVISLFSFTAGPAMAIIATDYYLIRKREISLDNVYNSKGKYRYYKGINVIAMVAYVVSTIVGFTLFSNLSFYVATSLAAILYYGLFMIYRNKYPSILVVEKGHTSRKHLKKPTTISDKASV